jgi:PAS domain-containing protein
MLRHVSALPILEWLDVPVLALAKDGTIVFANWAFADMLGQTPELVLTLGYRRIFEPVAEGDSPVAALRANADLVVQLAHLDGTSVQAKVGGTLSLSDDEVVLTSFDDMTEQLWVDEL